MKTKSKEILDWLAWFFISCAIVIGLSLMTLEFPINLIGSIIVVFYYTLIFKSLEKRIIDIATKNKKTTEIYIEDD